MFGHDNNNHHDDNNNGGLHIPAPDPGPDQQQIDDAATAPVPGNDQRQDSGLGGFIPDANEPGHSASGTDDLLDIKQEALQALTPLVGHLEQSPEEKFRTTMMMIQASDDHSLIRVAYAAAKEISNEKDRAQALLDIVNEINYFTQHHQA